MRALLICGAVLLAGAGMAAEAKKLLVVAPAQFQPALIEFVAHKRTLLPTESVSLEAVLKSVAGADDPEKLKRYLFEQWRTNHLGYVLLVGDVDMMPVRYMVLDRVDAAAFDYAFYPSDLYYSDLAKADGAFEDWNARKDSFHANYFGEVRGEKNKADAINYDEVDYRPDIAVGRWPVSQLDDVKLVAGKTIAYERTVRANTNSALHRAAFIAVSGWVDCRDMLDGVAAKLPGEWSVEKHYYTGGRRFRDALDPTRAEVREVFNSGVGLAIHTGHGQPDCWEKSFFLSDLDRLTNAAMLPVVMSAGCSTATFAPMAPYGAYVDTAGQEHRGSDRGEKFTAPPPPPAAYQRGRFNPGGLGEEILKRNTGGAVAYIGCNTGSQPCGLTLVDGFVSALAQSPRPRLGDCWASAVKDYYAAQHLATLKPSNDWYPPSIFFQAMKFMLFGDPSLEMPASRTPKSS